jgi:flagellar basal-body rod protein FlgC
LRSAQAAGVRVAEVAVDPAPPERRYLPQHPDADADGYVEFPSFNPVEDMVDLTAAVRGYQANLAVAGAVREMITRTIEVARG